MVITNTAKKLTQVIVATCSLNEDSPGFEVTISDASMNWIIELIKRPAMKWEPAL